MSLLISQITYHYIRFNLQGKPTITERLTIFLSTHQFRTIGIGSSIKMIVFQLLKPVLITLAPSSFRNIGIVWIHTMSARCFSCTYIIILLVKQGFRTMPMRFSHISRFITSSRKYISETNQAVGNTVLIVHMAIARYSILLRECTCHQHSTMRTT